MGYKKRIHLMNPMGNQIHLYSLVVLHINLVPGLTGDKMSSSDPVGELENVIIFNR